MTATITADQLLDATAAAFTRPPRNGRNPSNGTVHAVLIKREWVGDAPLPVPACGSGVGGTSGRLLVPTIDAVTCHRCQDIPAARAAAKLVPTPEQIPLDLLPATA